MKRQPFDWERLRLSLWRSRRKLGWGYLTEATVYLQASRRRTVPPSRFVIFAQPRSGSQLLCDLLNAHSQIQCDKELLYSPVLMPERLVRCCARLSKCDTYGFKLMLYQLTERQGIRDARAFLAALHNDGWKIIYLSRRNTLRHVLSHLLWRQSGKAHRYADKHGQSPTVEKVSVDCDRLCRRLERQRRVQRSEEEALCHLPCLRIVYDDDLYTTADQQGTVARIFHWLGLENEPVTSDLVRNTPERLVDLIENYDEVTKTLAATEFARFLE